MTQKKILSNNKLIAKFMGDIIQTKLLIGGEYFDEVWLRKLDKSHYIELYYHSSWDWLMPVIDKIMGICFSNDESGTHDSNQFYEIRDCIPDINQTYQSVINFIKWYNEQS